VRVAVRIFAQNSSDDTDAENDQCDADQPFSPMVNALGQAEVQLQDCDAERGHSEGVADGIGHPQSESAPPVALHCCDVGDGGKVIVVEAVAQPQDQAGAECRIKFPVTQNRYHEIQYNAYAAESALGVFTARAGA